MSEYKEEKMTKNKIKANEIIYTELPTFCHKYFEERRDLNASSKLSYAYSLLDFFTFLHTNDYFKEKDIVDYTSDDLNSLTKDDFEDFFNLKEISNKNKPKTGAKPNTLKRTKACLNSFWNFYIDEDIFHAKNPIKGIKLPQVESKDPVELTENECKKLFDTIKYGHGLSEKQLQDHDRCKERDFTIVSVFLDTGIRVAELVGIDLNDIQWDKHSIVVSRKGHKEQEVFFSDETQKILEEYVEIRKEKYWNPNSPSALFLNRFGERLSERSVERMMEKYVQTALPNRKNISCHKLRSTYAMQLLRYSGDLDLVSHALGHTSISTTQIYARTDIATRESVRNFKLNNR